MRLLCRLLIIVFLFSCSPSSDTKPLFELTSNTGIQFANNVVDGQIENSFYYRNYYNGGGVAIADINNDGLCDVLMTSNMSENKLFLNKGNWKFEDISTRSGIRQDSMWSTGAMMVDINNDGWLDIYVCNSGHMKNGNRRNKLYINNKDLTFTESAAKFGLDIVAYCTQVSFFDYDLDGDLDCFLINNSPMPINNLGYTNRRDLPEGQWPVAEFLKGGGDHLYRNDDGKFVEVSTQAGIHGTLISFGLGVSVGDINMDGYPDVYVANDSYERDYLYINQKNGTFKDEMEEWIEQNSFSSMGADFADVNNDGLMDIFTTDMLPGDDYRLKTLGAFDNIDLYNKRIDIGLYRQFMKNCLFVNNGNGKFLETANYSGVSATDWSWGALFFDADNDGRNDVYVCNGINRDVTNLDFMDFFANDVVQGMVISGHKQSVDSVLKHIPVYAIPNKVFRNEGNLKFTEVGKSWGMDQPSFSNGAAYGDLDNDGDLDLVVNNENMDAFVYRNNSREQNGNGYIGIVLKGHGNNTFAIGSKIRVYGGGEVFYRELVPSRGFQSSVDYKQVIGVGGLKQIDSVVVTWPDRRMSRYDKPELNKVHSWEEPDAGGRVADSAIAIANPELQSVTIDMEAHKEDDFLDFYYERNLPELLSTEGPKMARGDVNGDGLEDLYIGGAKGQAGQLYVQRGGTLVRQREPVFEEFRDFEDVAVLLFDADGDKDLDLFIGSGGNSVGPGSRELQHRLYLNDGKGQFHIELSAFPNNDMNISVASASDYDGDGDLDLFVGSRSHPSNYGVTPMSYLYRNDGQGHFTDVTREQAPELGSAGMITGAVWTDVTGDGLAELVMTGEWMAPRIFEYNRSSKRLTERKDTGLGELYGWWQTVSSLDVNGDGKQDLVLGNIGENFYLRPQEKEPVKLWLMDFDQNGTTESFLTRSVEGRDVPVFLKREVTEQFPGLKKQNLKHSDYAVKSIQELFGEAILGKSQVKRFTYGASVVAYGEGNGKFRVEALPMEVQLSSVNAVEQVDVNGDGKWDLVLGGNMFSFPPQFGRLDASYGHVLLGDGKGGWKVMNPRESGLSVKGAVKDIKMIKMGDKRYLLFVQNNDRPVMYSIKK